MSIFLRWDVNFASVEKQWQEKTKKTQRITVDVEKANKSKGYQQPVFKEKKVWPQPKIVHQSTGCKIVAWQWAGTNRLTG